jgi:hypothetical protein
VDFLLFLAFGALLVLFVYKRKAIWGWVRSKWLSLAFIAGGATLGGCAAGALAGGGGGAGSPAPSVGQVVGTVGTMTGIPFLSAAGAVIDALIGPLVGALGGAVGGRVWSGSARKLDAADWTDDDAIAMAKRIEDLKKRGAL